MTNVFSCSFCLMALVYLLTSPSWANNESPQSFTLDGTLLASDHVSPLLDSTAKVRVQVLNPSKTCVLYDEEQTVNTLSTNGHFNIQVGSAVGSAKRRALDSANAMARVYQNSSAIPAQAAPSQTCAGSSYTPVAGDVRYVRVIVTPTSSSPETLTPDMVLDSVPNAVVAQSLQGVEKSGFLQVNPSVVLTQAKLEQFMQTLTTVPGMSVTYDGTNFQSYDPKNGSLLSSGSVTDTQISDVEWAKITSVPPAINAVATLSCANGEILKFVSGAWACATESGVGVESDPTVETYAKHAPGAGLVVNGSNQLVPDFGATAGKVAQGNDSRFTDSRAPNGSASGDLSGSYPNPTVAKLQGRGVSVTAPADGQVLKYDNGTSTWVPANFGIADLKKSNGLSQFVSASCTSSQTLIWSAVTDDFSCTNISLPVGQVTGTLTIAQGGTGQTTASAAINALLPSQGSNSGKFLTTDGANVSWAANSMTESDPKVGANTTNYLSKWNGTALVASAVTELGGNVGIGTTTSVSKLHIAEPQTGNSVELKLTAGDSGHTASDGGGLVLTAGAAPILYLVNRENGPILFQNNGSNHMTILPNGNVGIGTSTPGTKLDVNGTINATAMTINGVPVGTATGITSINGSSQASQSFATPGTAGTAPNWSTNTGTGAHTLNIPMASTASVTAGLITKTDYDNFNGKIGSSYSLAGDVTGTPAATVVDRIKGKVVSAAPTLAGQVLRYDGTNITPNFISMFDLRSTVTGTQAFAAGCTAAQTLTWTSATDNLACTNIAITGAAVSGNIAGNAANVTGTVAIANGGTGQTTANAAFNALAPSQASNSGKFLTTNGTNTSWSTALTSESDPKVGANTTNYLSKWNGSALVASGVIESGGSVGIGTASPSAKLHVVGALRMVDGNQALGKVLTSDANGVASWQTPAGGGGGGDFKADGSVPMTGSLNMSGWTLQSLGSPLQIGDGVQPIDLYGITKIHGGLDLQGYNITDSYDSNIRLGDGLGKIELMGIANVHGGINMGGFEIFDDYDNVVRIGDGVNDTIHLRGNAIIDGDVGIGTSNPTAKLDVSGEIKFGNTSSTCNASTEGQQRYNSTTKKMQFCNGSSWGDIGAAAGPGTASAWVSFDGTVCSPNCTLLGAYNISSVARTATGNYTITFATPMASANYAAVLATNVPGNDGSKSEYFGTPMANSIDVYLRRKVSSSASAGESMNASYISVVIYGP